MALGRRRASPGAEREVEQLTAQLAQAEANARTAEHREERGEKLSQGATPSRAPTTTAA